MSTVPVPLAVTCCGLVAVLSLTVSVAERAPVSLGVKPIAIVQVPVGASPLPPDGQVEVPTANSAGLLDETLLTNSTAWPVFLTVRFLVTVSPTGAFPNASDVGTDATDVGVAVGVAVFVAVTVAVLVGVAVGVWVTVAVGVAVRAAVAVAVAVADAVAVALVVTVGVAVAVFVGVAVADDAVSGLWYWSIRLLDVSAT